MDEQPKRYPRLVAILASTVAIVPLCGLVALLLEALLTRRGMLFGVGAIFATLVACLVAPVCACFALLGEDRSPLRAVACSTAVIVAVVVPAVALIDPAEAGKTVPLFVLGSLGEIVIAALVLARVRAWLSKAEAAANAEPPAVEP